VKTITVEQFLSFKLCEDYPEKRIREIAGDKKEWSAIDILAREDVPAEDRLWVVLREELIDGPILHEFMCRIAERHLARVETPDPRSAEGLVVKRRWMRGEATDDELVAANEAATAAWRAAWAAAPAAKASEDPAAWLAAIATFGNVNIAAQAAREATQIFTRSAVRFAVMGLPAAEIEAQVKTLGEILEEGIAK
jgi:hypothetical protein